MLAIMTYSALWTLNVESGRLTGAGRLLRSLAAPQLILGCLDIFKTSCSDHYPHVFGLSRVVFLNRGSPYEGVLRGPSGQEGAWGAGAAFVWKRGNHLYDLLCSCSGRPFCFFLTAGMTAPTGTTKLNYLTVTCLSYTILFHSICRGKVTPKH